MAREAKETMLLGVPMLWMRSPYTPFPLFAKRGAGARVHDVDGNEFVDFFLSISAATFGHSPAEVVRAVTGRVRDGVTFMMPTEDSIWLGKELKRRFGLPIWQPAMTATDAVRFVMRIARATSGRRKVLVFNGCFHCALTETMVRLRDGVATSTLDSSEPVDGSLTTRVVEMNDVTARTATHGRRGPGDRRR